MAITACLKTLNWKHYACIAGGFVLLAAWWFSRPLSAEATARLAAASTLRGDWRTLYRLLDPVDARANQWTLERAAAFGGYMLAHISAPKANYTIKELDPSGQSSPATTVPIPGSSSSIVLSTAPMWDVDKRRRFVITFLSHSMQPVHFFVRRDADGIWRVDITEVFLSLNRSDGSSKTKRIERLAASLQAAGMNQIIQTESRRVLSLARLQDATTGRIDLDSVSTPLPYNWR
jgi:hypothetical protein